MSEKKTIQFNPELFNFNTNTNRTRKKRSHGNNNNEIRIRTKSSAKSKLDTLKKRSILKMIRQHQEQNYQKLLGKDISPEKKKQNETNYEEKFKSNFENSKEFLDNLVKENNKNQESNILNRTIKSYNTQPNSLLYNNIAENVSLEFPNDLSNIIENKLLDGEMKLAPSAILNLQPNYGCLKGGSLPTYRNWVNKTQKALDNKPTIVNNPINNTSIQNILRDTSSSLKEESNIAETKIDDNLKRMSEIKQTMERLEQIKRGNQKKRLKRKKTIRRTYKTGKSKTVPKISVLVSNRTIRNNITTKTQLLKQVPIQEVKQYLIKHGFIRVGTIAPNDVLRKIYESAILICGEVQNHNPDNLLYNFLNQ
jgi:hypothetical protein